MVLFSLSLLTISLFLFDVYYFSLGISFLLLLFDGMIMFRLRNFFIMVSLSRII